jgi:hypothetical protein
MPAMIKLLKTNWCPASSTLIYLLLLTLSACQSGESAPVSKTPTQQAQIGESLKQLSQSMEASLQPAQGGESNLQPAQISETLKQLTEGTGNDNQPATLSPAESGKQLSKLKQDLELSMATMAVEFTLASFDSVQSGKSWTREEIPKEFASYMNSTQTQSSGRKFTYVADQATGPWQVVLKVEGTALQVIAYGSNTGQVLEQQSIPISQNP